MHIFKNKKVEEWMKSWKNHDLKRGNNNSRRLLFIISLENSNTCLQFAFVYSSFWKSYIFIFFCHWPISYRIISRIEEIKFNSFSSFKVFVPLFDTNPFFQYWYFSQVWFFNLCSPMPYTLDISTLESC